VHLQPGAHFIDATALGGSKHVQKDVNLDADRQAVVHIELGEQREAGAAQRQQEEQQQAAARQQQAQPQADVVAELQYRQAQILYNQGSYADARGLLEQSCRGNSMRACDLLGDIYKFGRGVSPNPYLAREYYRKACDGGLSMGCTDARSAQ